MQRGSLSIDLDNLWSYLKVKGDSQWELYPSYFETFIPHFLDFLDNQSLNITFFIVGQDAALEKNHDLLKEITKRGHEAANHSFHHEPSMKLKSFDEVEREILSAEEAIMKATGQRTVGFRGPGFCSSKAIQLALVKNDYLYDSSLLPSFIGPLARLYFCSVAKTTPESKALYGSWGDAFKSSKNRKTQGSLLEMPVTTIPFLKLPFHMTYLLFLANISEGLMNTYLTTALKLCSLSNTPPNFLLHPTDFVGSDQIPELSYFPGMNIPTSKKRELCANVLKKLKQSFELGSLKSIAS